MMNPNSLFRFLPLLLLPLFTSASASDRLPMAQIQSQQTWSFSHTLKIDNQNISGIVVTPDFMALATDEGHQLELFVSNNGHWQSASVITLTQSTDELDIEGLAWQEPYLYALGSHSLKRKKLKDNLSQKENLKRLQQVVKEPARHQLFRIKLNAKLQPKAIDSLSLDPMLEQDPILNRFIQIPSKENGIDLEGLAIDDKGRLLIGFRGPVLRGNHVPILHLKLKKEGFTVKKPKMLYIQTPNGGGIRGINETPAGLLILTGAVGDQLMPYQVLLWNGKNGLEGNDSEKDILQPLCELPDSKGKPEGIQFVSQSGKQIQFVIVQDGLSDGQPTVFRCDLP
ncbi:DUF3616 domain-containing protein [Thiomicrorhabdus sp. ZW0627]|uniref:DUF3616 domain-containing protein n=1 Tax=Thiomicrorhabdus sp. ZW0627 TaxID=3039774 RepID=UPI0024366679|nr:DUF3616 domain-containing protein [Thiomicrorhabdus sp. ZW0627]MDG6774497.1 DUF3616 domain-containing protein [Thiomicrorhabdus sp. ZW0627]